MATDAGEVKMPGWSCADRAICRACGGGGGEGSVAGSGGPAGDWWGRRGYDLLAAFVTLLQRPFANFLCFSSA